MFGVKCDEVPMHKLCHACNMCISDRFNIHTHHVHGHSGHPWNDPADSVCNHFYTRHPLVLMGPIPIDDVSIFEVELVASVQVRQVCDSLNIDEDHDLCVVAARIDQQWSNLLTT